MRASLDKPDEPFEGKVPLAKIEEAVRSAVDADRRAGRRLQYLFDSFPLHASAADFHRFAAQVLGTAAPDYLFDLRAAGVERGMMAARQKKRLEAEELSEEQQAEFKNQVAAWENKCAQYVDGLAA